MKKIHIGFHKAGSTFLQQIVFPKIFNYKGRYIEGGKGTHTEKEFGKTVNQYCENILKYYISIDSMLSTYARNEEIAVAIPLRHYSNDPVKSYYKKYYGGTNDCRDRALYVIYKSENW